MGNGGNGRVCEGVRWYNQDGVGTEQILGNGGYDLSLNDQGTLGQSFFMRSIQQLNGRREMGHQDWEGLRHFDDR